MDCRRSAFCSLDAEPGYGGARCNRDALAVNPGQSANASVCGRRFLPISFVGFSSRRHLDDAPMIVLKVLIVIAAFAITLVALVVAGTVIGAVVGYVVGLFFGDTILGIASQLGIKHVEMWQIGAFLGFVSGFLRTNVEAKAS